MDRSRLLRRRQIGHFLHIGGDGARQLGGHGLVDHLLGLGLTVVHRQDEGIIAPGRPVALVEQRLQHLVGGIHLPRNTERGGVAAHQFGIVRGALQGGMIIALRPGLVAGHVARKATVALDGHFGIAGTGRLVEQAQRFGRVLHLQHDPAQARLGASIIGLDRVGAGKETGGRAGVVQLQRGFPCPHQRAEITRICGQLRQIIVEVRGARGPDQIGLVGLRLRSRGKKQAAENP